MKTFLTTSEIKEQYTRLYQQVQSGDTEDTQLQEAKQLGIGQLKVKRLTSWMGFKAMSNPSSHKNELVKNAYQAYEGKDADGAPVYVGVGDGRKRPAYFIVNQTREIQDSTESGWWKAVLKDHSIQSRLNRESTELNEAKTVIQIIDPNDSDLKNKAREMGVAWKSGGRNTVGKNVVNLSGPRDKVIKYLKFHYGLSGATAEYDLKNLHPDLREDYIEEATKKPDWSDSMLDLYIRKDRNGNKVLKVVLPNLRFNIQTNGNLPKTHSRGAGDHTIGELIKYVKSYGSTMQKNAISKYARTKIDEGVDKSSPIYKEYEELKKLPIKSLRNKLGQTHKIVDLKGYDKEGAISQILRDKHGDKKVDAAFGFSESTELSEGTLTVKKMVTMFRNKDDWGDEMPLRTYVEGGRLIFLDSYWAGGDKALDDLVKSWKPGGSYYDYFKKNYGAHIQVVNSFKEMKAIDRRHKKFTKNGVVGVELKVKSGSDTPLAELEEESIELTEAAGKRKFYVAKRNIKADTGNIKKGDPYLSTGDVTIEKFRSDAGIEEEKIVLVSDANPGVSQFESIPADSFKKQFEPLDPKKHTSAMTKIERWAKKERYYPVPTSAGQEFKFDSISGNFVREELEEKALTEAAVIDQLKNILDNHSATHVKTADGKRFIVDPTTAKAILTVYKALNKQNQKRTEELMSSSKVNFMKFVDFAWRQVESTNLDIDAILYEAKTIKVGEDAINADYTTYALVKERLILAIGEKEEMKELAMENGGRVWLVNNNRKIGNIVEETETEYEDSLISYDIINEGNSFMQRAGWDDDEVIKIELQDR